MEKFYDSGDEAALADALGKLPNGVTLSWGFIKQPRRGPKGELSIEMIVSAAVGIADRDGLSALSMSRVAQALGYSTMSLYRYVTSKEDLLILMQDAVCAIPFPPIEAIPDWREGMRVFVRMNIGVFRTHPWFADMPIAGAPLTPNCLRLVDWVLGTMRNCPVSDHEKMGFIMLLSSYARANGILQRDMDRAVQAGRSEEEFGGYGYSDAMKQLVKSDTYPHLYPVIQSGAYTGEADSSLDDDLDFGLERILDGIAVYLDARGQ
jgi:AcrR family transcriptional regulator